MENKPPPTVEGDHSAGRRAREVYRYFKPERLTTISENASLSSGNSSQRGRLSHDDLSTHLDKHSSVSSQLSNPQSSHQSICAPLGALPESLVLGESSSTLNLFAQLAALRLNVDRVFIR